MRIIKIIIGLLVILGITIFFMYGTLNPCGILKKEIAMQIQKQSEMEQGMYLLFGGFFERNIDGLTPLQCVQKIYEIKTQGYERTLSEMM